MMRSYNQRLASGDWYEDAEGDLVPASPEGWDELFDGCEEPAKPKLKRARPGTKRAEAEEFLLRELADGPRSSSELIKIARAQKARYSTATLQDARRGLGVSAFFNWPEYKWFWAHPEHVPTDPEIVRDHN